MQTTATLEYLGELRLRAEHTKSGTQIETVAPVDNHGKGDSFSPTDLLSTSLASCILTIMGIKANSMEKPLTDAKASVVKVMAANPRRVAEVIIEISLPSQVAEEDRKVLEAAGRACPVAKSLHPDLKQNITFNWNL
jgi:uncharacterized OsmC-like protein